MTYRGGSQAFFKMPNSCFSYFTELRVYKQPAKEVVYETQNWRECRTPKTLREYSEERCG